MMPLNTSEGALIVAAWVEAVVLLIIVAVLRWQRAGAGGILRPAKDQQGVQALAPDRAHQALGVGILPR